MRARTAIAGVSLLLAGCGSGGAPASDAPKDVFASTCGGCHTLKAAGTSGGVGPNLDDLKPDRARVLRALGTGPGAMPKNLLTGDAAARIADYVSANAGR